MISIRRATEDLDRVEHATRTLAGVYDHAIWSTAQYAIEVDHGAVVAFREHLTSLRDQIGRASTPEDWQVVQASFRGELRHFRDQSTQQLTRIRSEFAAAIQAMHSFADSVISTGEDHQDTLREALGQLNKVAEGTDLDAVRAVIRKTTSSIEESVERMQKLHQVAIAQLRDEIRLLQSQVEVERQAAQMDQATGVWNRQHMDATIAKFTDKDEAFSLLILCVRNLRRLDGQFSRPAIDMALRAMAQRLTAMLDDSSVAGRWDDESFAVILCLDPSEAIRVSREAAKRLSGNYAVQDAGVARQVPLTVVTGVIDHLEGTGSGVFAQRLAQMSNALAIA
ncbi:MAG: GGDEF domain-containing protein [Bryobacteraceae bacterium]